MNQDLLKIWIPIKKTDEGKYSAILTDTSLDRDNEMMAESVMDQLSKQMALPALADHENKMDSWVGCFKNLQKVHNNGHYAVTAEPTFFSKEANPRAAQIKKQIDEAHEMGMTCGVSIGAKPIKSEMITKDGKQIKSWTEIEVMEGTFTPIQSNRNSYAYVAKSFGLEKNKEKVMMCVKHLMEKGKNEKEAHSICHQEVYGNKTVADLIHKQVEEELTMQKKDDIKKNEDATPGKPVEDKPTESADKPDANADKNDKPVDAATDDKTDKVADIDIQKLVDEGIQKAMAKIPKLKAIQEPSSIPDTQDKKPMGMIETHFAKKYGYTEDE